MITVFCIMVVIYLSFGLLCAFMTWHTLINLSTDQEITTHWAKYFLIALSTIFIWSYYLVKYRGR